MSKTLANATLLEIRQALAGGRNDATLDQAIDELRRAGSDAVERERRRAAYDAYLETRKARRAAAISDATTLAVDEAESDATNHEGAGFRRFRNLTGGSKIGAGQRSHIAQEAATEAAAEFDIREPLLQEPEWQDAGAPDVFQRGIVGRTAARAKALVA